MGGRIKVPPRTSKCRSPIQSGLWSLPRTPHPSSNNHIGELRSCVVSPDLRRLYARSSNPPVSNITMTFKMATGIRASSITIKARQVDV